ncbi:MAG: molecular chaperone HtpG [Mariprofundaceae bacterium]
MESTVPTDTKKETLGFQAEVQQLLHLMVHALYSNKEIFLRELISNAADAADKLRFEALADDGLWESDTELAIRVSFDKKKRSITVSDNGIGMSRQEVIDNIGTIAKSGTREFVSQLTGDEARDRQLIGQFGVGFYSSFIIAERVEITTRRAGFTPEHGVRWESDGSGSYTLETVDKPSRGTEITLHLKKGEKEFLDADRLSEIIRKYSDHIPIAILMGKNGKSEKVNQASALWARPRKDIKPEEYDEFYKYVAHDFEAPASHVHARLEGRTNYTALLYIPARQPFDLWNRDTRHGLKLYVQRVFIMDAAEDLLPAYLRFVHGVVDSDDLPLNISREILQHNPQAATISKGIVKRVIDLLTRQAEKEPEKYAAFWSNFGAVFKEGVIEDDKNREKITKLLRFSSTRTDAQEVALADYVARMPEGQKSIYYITADNINTAKSSPHLEVFQAKNIEVLLLTDPVDEWLVSHLPEFDGKPLESIAKGTLDLGEMDSDEEADKPDEQVDDAIIAKIRAALGEQVKEVRSTRRLTTSPACLVADQFAMGAHMERLLANAGQDVPASKPILEINLTHPLIVRLAAEKDESCVNSLSHVLFDQARLSEGQKLEDPAAFVRRLNELLLSLSSENTAKE